MCPSALKATVDYCVEALIDPGLMVNSGMFETVRIAAADYAEVSRLTATEVPACTLNYRMQAYRPRKAVKEFQCLPGLLLNNSGSAFDATYLA